MYAIKSQVVTTRKPHQCWGCKREFPAGSKLEAITNVDEVIQTTYWCPVCVEVWNILGLGAGDDVACGELRASETDLWEETAALQQGEHNAVNRSTTMDIKLCPFCGKTPCLLRAWDVRLAHHVFMVQCRTKRCPLKNEVFYLRAWNRRTPVSKDSRDE
jgi:hypothetical protein